jgi:hypothetical protein
MSIEESKLKAFSLWEDVRKNNPNFLIEAAKKVIERHNLWEAESLRLNSEENKKPVGDPTWKRIEPSIIHPFLCFTDNLEKGKYVLPTFSNKDDAFIVSAGITLALHDLTPGAVRITEGIWPPDWLKLHYEQYVFNPIFGDKTIFIEAAIRHVEANLARTEPAETDSQQRKIGLLSELTPDDRRNEQRKR